MKPTIYIETTIPSYYFNTRKDAELQVLSKWTREWWDEKRHEASLVTSTAVLEELSRGNHPFKAEKLALLEKIPLLPTSQQVIDVAHVYVARKAMPNDPKGDALHLAFASVYKCDMLVSWNCRHIVNYQKAGYLKQLNTELRLGVPMLVTPMELLNRSFDK
jgi:predicted nucleic acid-binding protein